MASNEEIQFLNKVQISFIVASLCWFLVLYGLRPFFKNCQMLFLLDILLKTLKTHTQINMLTSILIVWNITLNGGLSAAEIAQLGER